jgi:hypothetical protein
VTVETREDVGGRDKPGHDEFDSVGTLRTDRQEPP